MLVGAFFALAEIEHVEQITNCRAVHWHIRIVSVWMRVRQIIAAAAGERGETPVALDEFQDRGMVVIAVHHMAASGIG